MKWLFVACVVGGLGGALGSLFNLALGFVTGARTANPTLIYFLPLGGIIIAFAYSLAKKYGNIDTNRVLQSAESNKSIPFVMVPLIFFGASVTHLFGGSAGREGAALQLGGGMAYSLGKLFRFKNSDMHTIVLCGMSAVFSALFGTPLAAAFFSLEVVNVGIMHYNALVPCIASSLCAFGVSLLLGVTPVRFSVPSIELSLFDISKTILLSVLCAALSILFCVAIEKGSELFSRLFPNSYIKGFVGGIIIVLLTLAVGSYDYNGAGMDVVALALGGVAFPFAFLLKLLFTSITVASGFKGGEIVPAFFVGATFGCTMGGLLGLDPAFAAAIGFVTVFCGAVNCPIASLLLAVEVFGGQSLAYFAISCAISFMMSGNFSLYSSQKLAFSKLSEKYIGKDC